MIASQQPAAEGQRKFVFVRKLIAVGQLSVGCQAVQSVDVQVGLDLFDDGFGALARLFVFDAGQILFDPFEQVFALLLHLAVLLQHLADLLQRFAGNLVAWKILEQRKGQVDADRPGDER